MRVAIILGCLVVAACGPTEEERRADDAADVAAVNAAQNRLPPVVPVRPELLIGGDMERIDASGPGCTITIGDTLGPPVFVAVGSYGWIKLDGLMIKFAGDTGSERGPEKTWTRYTGRERTLRIEDADAMPLSTGEGAGDSDVVLTMRDAWDRVVYRGNGWRTCVK